MTENIHDHERTEEAKIYAFPDKATNTTGQPPDGEGAPVVEGEVVTAEAVEAILVDQPETTDRDRNPLVRKHSRRPILPNWLRTPEQFRAAARWAAGYTAHAAGYHALRCPVYVSRLLARVPQGTWRLVRGLVRWATDAEGRPLRHAAARREDGAEYLKLSRQRDVRVRARTVLLAAGTTTALVTVLLGLPLLPELGQWAIVTAAVTGLGFLGTPEDQQVFSRAVVSTKVARLTSDIVVKALSSLGIAEINKAVSRGGGVTFPKPITRDGPGWRADVDLPHGVTVTDIVERREKLASGLRRPIGCVWPEPDGTEHAGRLVLWVGDQDMSQIKPATWPLAKNGQADIFKPVPFGTDQRGRPVSILLMFANVLIGAMPRFGKTFALRVLALAAALDPTVELRIFELKGTGDLSALEKVAHHYGCGPDDGTVEATVASLREVHEELERRAKTISQLPKTICPENKVTPQLAARAGLGLQPLCFIVDECQELFSHPDFGKEAGELATAIIKRGPAMGVMLILATQRPDKDSLPTGVSANVGIRFCLRVMGQMENDMVLGTSAYKNGIRATTFTAKDKGIGYLVGNSDDPQITRSYYIDGPAAERIADRARGLREAAGTLSGHAIGESSTHERSIQDTVLEDVLAVIGSDEPKVWTETAVARLATSWPERYGGWDGDQLTAALKPHGIKTNRQIWGADEHGEGRNRRGFHRADIAESIAERNRKREAG